jgi:hypothetical protein
MPTAFIRHRVRDYAAWRRVYDEFTETHPSGLPVAPAVYRAVDDPNDVLVIHRFGDATEIQPWLDDEDRRKAMLESGVMTPPQIVIALD